MQRDVLATEVSALEQKIETSRLQMDGQKRRRFDLAQNMSEAQSQLGQLDQARRQAETAESAPIVVENYPTPISRLVDSDEAHFQLSGGSIVHIPLQELLEQFRTDARRKTYKLLELPEITETIGPVDGFRLKYTLERRDSTPEDVKSTGRMGSYVQLKKWTLIPVVDALGEPPDVALGEGSAFRKALAKLRPGQHTITIWTYDDSFGSFRQIRKELYRLGFTTAARPITAWATDHRLARRQQIGGAVKECAVGSGQWTVDPPMADETASGFSVPRFIPHPTSFSTNPCLLLRRSDRRHRDSIPSRLRQSNIGYKAPACRRNSNRRSRNYRSCRMHNHWMGKRAWANRTTHSDRDTVFFRVCIDPPAARF